MVDVIDNGRTKSKLPSQLISPTAFGTVVSAAVNCKQPFNIPANTTLNEKYDVLAVESVGVKHGKDFNLGYYGIGIGGSRSVGADTNGLEGRKVYQHKATDQAAFYPIPFLIRTIDNDIDPAVRENYRMRVVRKIGEITYVMYYLKKIGFQLFDPSVKIGTRDETTGNETEYLYEYKKEDLSPTPYELLTTNSIPLSNTYANGTGKLDLSLNNSDLNEIRNVCTILFNDVTKAAINEMYLVHGIETTFDGQIGSGGTVNYKELLSAVTSFTITEAWARDANANSTMPWYFHIGNSLPMLVAQDALV